MSAVLKQTMTVDEFLAWLVRRPSDPAGRTVRGLTGLVLPVFLAALTTAPVSAQENTGFRLPTTQAERALDGILKHVDADEQALDNLLGGRNRTYRRTVDYRPMMTQPLLAAIAAKEKANVKRDCGGRYIAGDLCGLGYVPITCAQDTNDTYFYRTEAESGDQARIAYAWTKANAVAVYRMVKRAGAWKIDGIRCKEGDAFNMP